MAIKCSGDCTNQNNIAIRANYALHWKSISAAQAERMRDGKVSKIDRMDAEGALMNAMVELAGAQRRGESVERAERKVADLQHLVDDLKLGIKAQGEWVTNAESAKDLFIGYKAIAAQFFGAIRK
jgi:hypothetical protein